MLRALLCWAPRLETDANEAGRVAITQIVARTIL